MDNLSEFELYSPLIKSLAENSKHELARQEWSAKYHAIMNKKGRITEKEMQHILTSVETMNSKSPEPAAVAVVKQEPISPPKISESPSPTPTESHPLIDLSNIKQEKNEEEILIIDNTASSTNFEGETQEEAVKRTAFMIQDYFLSLPVRFFFNFLMLESESTKKAALRSLRTVIGRDKVQKLEEVFVGNPLGSQNRNGVNIHFNVYEYGQRNMELSREASIPIRSSIHPEIPVQNQRSVDTFTFSSQAAPSINPEIGIHSATGNQFGQQVLFEDNFLAQSSARNFTVHSTGGNIVIQPPSVGNIPQPAIVIQQNGPSSNPVQPSPLNNNLQPNTPTNNLVRQSCGPSRNVAQPTTPEVQIVQPTTPEVQIVQPTTPQVQIVQPTTPEVQIVQPTIPEVQIIQSTTPHNNPVAPMNIEIIEIRSSSKKRPATEIDQNVVVQPKMCKTQENQPVIHETVPSQPQPVKQQHFPKQSTNPITLEPKRLDFDDPNNSDGKSEYIISCDLCPRKFMQRKYYIMHHKAKHCGIKPLRCHHCGRRYDKEDELAAHVDKHNQKDRPFACNQCDKSFLVKLDLKRHLYKHSMDTAPFQCLECLNRFTRKDHVRRHKCKVQPKPKSQS